MGCQLDFKLNQKDSHKHLFKFKNKKNKRNKLTKKM